jgi:multidrug efflux system membrane fusion protein
MGRPAHRPKVAPDALQKVSSSRATFVGDIDRSTARLWALTPGDMLTTMTTRREIRIIPPHPSNSLASSVAIVAAVLAVVLASGCTRTAAQPGEPPPSKVTVAKVAPQDVTEWDEFTGRLEAVNSVSVRPRVSGYVSAVRFEEGAIVRNGDPLFLIDPRPFEAEVDRLRAELNRARATVQRAKSELDRAGRLASENAMSHEEQERRASFAEESSAQVAAVEAALRAAQLNLEFTRITSPIDGRVGRAIVTQGNLVSSGPGEATILTTVVSLDPIYATFDADEQAYLQYAAMARKAAGAKGQGALPIRLALASDRNFPIEGKLNFLDNQIDPATGTIRARAIFRNADRSLTPGLFVRLQLPKATQRAGLLIQDRAVGTDLDKRFVYVVKPDHTIEYRGVVLGPLVNGLRVVRSGVNDGDLVVVNGLQRVRPGVKVEPVVVAMDEPVVPAEPKAASGGEKAGAEKSGAEKSAAEK